MSIKPMHSGPIPRSTPAAEPRTAESGTAQTRPATGPAGAPVPPADPAVAAEPARAPVSRQLQQEARLRVATDPTGLAMRRALEARLPAGVPPPVDVSRSAGPAGAPAGAIPAAAPSGTLSPGATRAPAAPDSPGTRVRRALNDGATPEQVNDLIRSMPAEQRPQAAAAMLDDVSFRPGLEPALTQAAGGPAAMAEARRILRASDAASTQATQAVSAAVETVKEADSAVERADLQLAAELGRVGGALTPAETAAYREQFWARDENKGLREAAAGARDALAGTLKEHEAALTPTLEQGPGSPDAEPAALMLEDAYGALAKDPRHADAARDFVQRAADPSTAAHAAFHPDRLETILASGAQAKANEVLSNPSGTPQAAYEAASGYLGALKDTAGLGQGITEALGALDRVAAGDAGALRAFASADPPESLGRLGGIAALAGMASAAAGVAGASSTLDMAAAAAEGIGSGMDFAAGLLQAGATAGGSQALAGALMETGGKLAGALGGLLNTVGHAQDAMGPGGTRADTVAAVASAVSVAAAFVPVGGTLVSAAAALVATVAGAQGDASREDTLRDNTRQGLADIGIDMSSAAVDELFDSPGAVASLAATGCSPEYIRALAQRVGNTDHSLASLASMITPVADSQVAAEQIVRWALFQDGDRPGTGIRGPM